MTRGRISVFLATVVATIGLLASAAGSEEAQQQGWWTTNNPGTPLDATFAPDVPPDGLLVQGGQGTPSAFSALLYTVEPDAKVRTLTLTVDPASISNAGSVLAVCPLVSPAFTPAQGGPIVDAPEYNCTAQVAGTTDGTAYSFDVSALVVGSSLAVAVVPTSPLDRVVFDKPGPDSLVTQKPGPPETPTTVPSATMTTTPTASTFPTTRPSMTVPLPALPTATATPEDSASSEVAVLAVPLVPIQREVDPAADGIAVGLTIVGSLVGAALWLYARRAAAQMAGAVELA